MADFVSHYLFGTQALTEFPSKVQRIAANRQSCFNFGCQGPDPMFYRKALLGGPLHKLGNRMHSEKTDELFYALSKTVNSFKGVSYDIAAAYFYGFVCHYALDSEIHPYVYCLQERFAGADPKLSKSAVHCQIESDIDYLLYERMRARPVTEFKPKEFFSLAPEEKVIISVLLYKVLLSVYEEDVPPKEIRKAFDEMLVWEDFLYSDKRGFYKASKALERVVGKGALITGHMKAETPSWDALNQEHNPWHNLWEPENTRTESVPELFAKAKKRASELAKYYAEKHGPSKYHFECPFDNGSPKKVGVNNN